MQILWNTSGIASTENVRKEILLHFHLIWGTISFIFRLNPMQKCTKKNSSRNYSIFNKIRTYRKFEII